MPENNYHLNLATIVHRLLTSHRGWSVDHLMEEMEIQPRTYRKYRKVLMEQFTPFHDGDGSLIHEVRDGQGRYLRLRHAPATEAHQKEFASRVAALHFANLLLQFVENTDIGTAMGELISDFETALKDCQFALTHLLRNVDRIFFQLPDAPKDYSEHGSIIGDLLRALIFTHRVRISYDSASFDNLKLELEPFTIAVHRSALYLMARAVGRTDVRIYAVDRIRELEVLPQKFDYPKAHEFSPDEYTEGSFGIFRSDSDEVIEFELLFADKKWLKLYVSERRWHPTQKFEELPDGRLRMRFKVNTDVEVWPWIRSFGEDVVVRSPTGRG